jgi:hypothetical protein
VKIDVRRLLALPAAERLELAEMLKRSVGYPADIETLLLPAWQRAHMDNVLKAYSGDGQECQSSDLRV